MSGTECPQATVMRTMRELVTPMPQTERTGAVAPAPVPVSAPLEEIRTMLQRNHPLLAEWRNYAEDDPFDLYRALLEVADAWVDSMAPTTSTSADMHAAFVAVAKLAAGEAFNE